MVISLLHLLSVTLPPVYDSFDFAQQVHYPSDLMQPGPIYFLTPRKCDIFGVCFEAIPWQLNYLIDEGVDVGKGSNTVVWLLHHFFETDTLGESDVHLHADNCVEQNRNNTILQVSEYDALLITYSNFNAVNFVVGYAWTA